MALYRKYRPTKFSDLLERGNVADALESSIKEGRISHAYLFSGGRGTGKTSIARIFAKALQTDQSDIYEMDAASNRGIDEVRALREAVHTLPYRSKYKVYIIDEVHMMSKDAFNALLKTLEEPPSHVIFILATTDPEKLPDTVISRCQHFKFKKPSEKTLRDMVISVGKGEGFVVENGGAELMAILGDGSFRDTLGILQKVISFASEKKVTEKHVLEVTGAPSSAIVNSIIEGIENAKVEDVLLSIREASESNSDMKSLAKLVIRKVRAVMLLRYAPTMEKSIKEEYSEHDFVLLQKLSQSKSSRLGARSLSRLLVAYEESGRSHLPQLSLELAAIELCANVKEVGST
ncbi:MAG: DNA polymerase III, subunit gamma and tau [Candidatus Taylorbacteria bacterium RIFCSPHIGHO2_02_FULL_43_32b]|uniref:DNA polymerase III subunit gamma/tau n=1 Tax=Candidatus Taylorbacteria bacterium RIFCSPHIGHO2_02_FULL_43_32b TaxID=1802306 RepID=A0A1G2MND6_9BACT|nr:MAG: DNA polymerase III, subunit gamma and tau [Candidatus Taylorbacteria bacterium RIFCSPHIGHO2_02_FULL_43_32b]